MTTFTPTNTGARFTDTDGDVSFTATPELARFTAAYQSVTGGGGASALDDLSDVTLTSPSNGQVLKYNGSAWVNGTDSTGSGGSGNIAVQGVLPADLDVTGGTFTTLDRLGVDGTTVITADVPRAFVVGVTGIILSGANAGVWTITASGPCTQTEVLGGQIVVAQESGVMAAAFIGTNTDGPNGAVDITEPATAFTLSPAAWAALIGKPSTFASDWSTLASKPARITSLESFVRPTVIFARLHFGGEPAAEGESALANWLNPATGEILAPIYNATNFPTKLPAYYEEDGTPSVDTWDYDDKPVIDGAPWQAGQILLVDQANWEANGPWDIVDDGGTWVAQRSTDLNGWVSDAMVVEGMPFWIGSGRHHRLKVGSWFYSSIAPTDPEHTVGFHRNEASDSYYTPAVSADWDTPPTRCAPAHDELAQRVREIEDAPSGSGDVVGPASAVDGRAVLFDGTTGKLIKAATEAPVLEGDSRLTDSRTPTAHEHGASEITGGTLATARLGSGTADSTTFLRGDQTWATPAGGGATTRLGAVLSAQTAGSGTDMNTGNGHSLLDSAFTLGTASAGDLIQFEAVVALLNNSGGARNYRVGLTVGSTFIQTGNLAVAANVSTYYFTITGAVHVLTTGTQQLAIRPVSHPLQTTVANAAGPATEDFTSSKTMQLHMYVNPSTATQSVQLQSFYAWRLNAS